MDLGESHDSAGGIERSCGEDGDEEEKRWQSGSHNVCRGSEPSGGIVAKRHIGVFYHLRVRGGAAMW